MCMSTAGSLTYKFYIMYMCNKFPFIIKLPEELVSDINTVLNDQFFQCLL
jgi:hypothetical protein